MKLQPGCLATAAKKTEDTTSEDGHDSNFASFVTSREQWLRYYWNAEIAKDRSAQRALEEPVARYKSGGTVAMASSSVVRPSFTLSILS